ncbi:membrane protein [Ktedonobacter sp. SOSP1-52]|uniref:AzlD domain-containing protein n=1 Tax=Ktedonobacter sp. SOSP1-52 TaxID=2778366 RepID=UPI00191590B5|nr:AzlD domain-containing protein [Ktedonobacter sp. SOSP1-52]GHO61991.1 membrane protein [Ktedonobacter sp. SOSP1-52]
MMTWLLIIGIGLLTYGLRLSFILGLGRVEMPALVLRTLRFVPIAVLTAIIVPQLLLPGGAVDLSLHNPRWLAGLLAALIAWRTRNVFLTIVIGMLALWGLQALFG